MSLLVKICGLSTRETLDAALVAGADMVGFVFFAPSPRHLSLETARELGRQAKGRAAKVALSVDADDATLENIVETLQPDLLQLHGKETIARVRDIKAKFGLPVMKVIAVETSADLAALPGYTSVADRILFDARAPKDATRPGGLCSTGMCWKISISNCPSWFRAGLAPRMSRRRCASPAPAASTCPPALKVRQVTRIPR
jgi:phosphoribosylanthranilate isomerase